MNLVERRRVVEARLATLGKVRTGTPADMLGLDDETLHTLQGMDDDEQPVVSLRTLQSPGGDDQDDDDDDDKDDSHEEPEDDEPVVDEDTTTSSPAKWTPVPTKNARQFVKRHPEAAIDVVFPTVYEEDRSAKLKDLGTAQALGAISHRRMAEQMAKELGFDPYNYQEEMDQIKDENPPIDPAKTLGSGDKVVQGILGPLAGTPPKPGAPGGGAPGEFSSPDIGGGFPGKDVGAPEPFSGPGAGTASEYAATKVGMRNGTKDQAPSGPNPSSGISGPGFATPEDGGKRAQLSGPVQAEFRKQQRQVEAMERKLEKMNQRLARARESLVRISETQKSPAQPVVVNIAPPRVNVAPPTVRVKVEKGDAPVVNVKPPVVTVNVPPIKPVVNVEVQAPEPKTMRYERDENGAIIRAVPEE